MQNLINILKSDKQFLLDKLFQYGSIQKKHKQYSCIHCSSSDALSIKEKDGAYFYKCFSCGATGDIINLVEQKENISFTEAVELLANEKGLVIHTTPGAKKSNTKKYDYEKLKKIKEYKIAELLKYQSELIQDKTVSMADVFEIDELIKEIKKHDYKFTKEEYKRLVNAIKIQKDDNDNIILLNSKLSERCEDVRYILNQGGLTLLSAPTGSGKTFTIIDSFKKLSSIYQDRVFVILCPNRVQNEQNGKEYEINVVVGGINAEKSQKIMSGVYEKIDEIIDAYRNKDITLVVDEAHELIESINYRKQAINKVKDAMPKTYNTIHMTATPRKLKRIYEYENIYKFDHEFTDYNLNNFTIIPAKNTDETLFTLLKANKEANKKSLVFVSGSKSDLKTLGDVLKQKNYITETITSDDKQGEVYQTIVNSSTIPAEYDVILTTKVLECGTNLQNTDIVPIEVIKNPNHFNLDSTQQKFARLRKKNNEAFLIIPEPKETKSIVAYEEIEAELENFVLKQMKAIEILKESERNIALEDHGSFLKESIHLPISAITSRVSGMLDFDEETLEVTLNREALINKAFREYDKQFLSNLDMLVLALKENIKANNIQIIGDIVNNDNENFIEELKEAKKLTKEIKAANTEKAKKIILNLYKEQYLEEYLLSEDKYKLLQSYKNNISEALFRDFKFIEQEEKELLKIEKLYNLTGLQENMERLIKVYQVCKTVADVDRYTKKVNYLEFNYIHPKELPDIYSSYVAIRRKFDTVNNVRVRVTQKSILELVEDLYNKKLLWQFDKKRVKEDYENYLIEENATKKKKILNRIIDKTVHELQLIYTLKNDEKGCLISSLK